VSLETPQSRLLMMQQNNEVISAPSDEAPEGALLADDSEK